MPSKPTDELNLRTPRFISPTALHLFEWSREEYAQRYLINPAPPRPPQTKAMALGSGFDAFVKSSLHKHFYGDSEEYELTRLFNSQVDEHLWEEIYPLSEALFTTYTWSGAYDMLLQELEAWGSPPRFEVGAARMVGGVPIYGKPDLYFISTRNIKVIYDWKVNGYFSKSNTSPMKGYTWCWDNNTGEICQHKSCKLADFHGVPINTTFTMDQCDKKWADQLAMYSWIMGNQVGSTRCVFGIDQIVGRPEKLRICRHRLRMTSDWQLSLLKRLQATWHDISTETVLPPEEIELLCGPETQEYSILDMMGDR